ncbi:uncharacterized protein RJT21DRAFT_112565 [Scheffersomyces amazonensis]|uniref:uncharacterized protein n=1 Tax=Scheffersomyces amazonensis TaxID=1078765 RepID=UPI00315CCCB8
MPNLTSYVGFHPTADQPFLVCINGESFAQNPMAGNIFSILQHTCSRSFFRRDLFLFIVCFYSSNYFLWPATLIVCLLFLLPTSTTIKKMMTRKSTTKCMIIKSFTRSRDPGNYLHLQKYKF